MMSKDAREWLCEQVVTDDKQRKMLMDPYLTSVSLIALLLDLNNQGFLLEIHKTHKEAAEVILLTHKNTHAEKNTDYYDIFLKCAEESVWSHEVTQYPGYIYISVDSERG